MEENDVLNVSQAVEIAQGTLKNIPKLCVVGEVSGFRGPARSGHYYFTIKDDSSALDVIIWRGTYSKRTFDLRDGLKIQFKGTFQIYAPTGKLSFIISSFSLLGEGLLRQQVAQRAEKLRLEGLMDASRKRKIPAFCNRVAVVTSLSGKVIGDVKRTLARRNPLVEVLCVNTAVQGEGAEKQIMHALDVAARVQPDCILLVRGGGSFEDLMTFNDENLARKVASSPVPIVTGIGHEPDTSICDMVSDRRASTPTAAAESVAPAFEELQELLFNRSNRLQQAMVSYIDLKQQGCKNNLDKLMRTMKLALNHKHSQLTYWSDCRALNDPMMVIDRRCVELAQTQDRLFDISDYMFDRKVELLKTLKSQLSRQATQGFVEQQLINKHAVSTLYHIGRQLVHNFDTPIQAYAAKLEALSPLAVLSRGYSITYKNHDVVTSSLSLTKGDVLHVQLNDGDVVAHVDEVHFNTI